MLEEEGIYRIPAIHKNDQEIIGNTMIINVSNFVSPIWTYYISDFSKFVVVEIVKEGKILYSLVTLDSEYKQIGEPQRFENLFEAEQRIVELDKIARPEMLTIRMQLSKFAKKILELKR